MATPCCKEGKFGCELATVSASQIGSAIAFMAILVKASYEALQKLPSADTTVSVQFAVFLGISIMYFFCGCAICESEYVDLLRTLGKPWRNVEFLIRLSVVVSFAFFNSVTVGI